jgi:DNA-binding IclR family transcriptional regulator
MPRLPSTQLTALRRSFAVLKRLAQSGKGCAFSNLQTIEDGLSAASLSRLLKVMQAEGLVAKEPSTGLYHTGSVFLQLARQAAGTVPVREILQPVVEALANRTGESAAWFERDGNSLVLTAKHELPERFHYVALFSQMGTVTQHGFGQTFLAWLPDEDSRALLDNSMQPSQVAGFRKRLAEIRAGLVCVPEWNAPRPIVRVNVPVFRGLGGPLAGILGVSLWGRSISAALRKRLEAAVKEHAGQATRSLM